MTPEAYAALRASLGERDEAARVLGCSPVALRLLEDGHVPITEAAAPALRDAVHAVALDEDARRERRRTRKLARLTDAVLTPAQFRACMRVLGWRTNAEAARVLLGDERDSRLISA